MPNNLLDFKSFITPVLPTEPEVKPVAAIISAAPPADVIIIADGTKPPISTPIVAA
jgi:hypothetical protein